MSANQFRSAMVFAVVFALAIVMPSSFLIESPGAVIPVTAAGSEAAMIDVEGAPTYPSDTSFSMTTVSSLGTASAGAPAGAVVASLINPRWQVLPVRALYPQQMTRQEQIERAEGQMSASQSSAELVALEAAGYEVSMTLAVGGIPEGSPAEGKLAEGDVVRFLRVGERTVEATSFSRFIGALEEVEPGTEVVVGYERDGEAGEAAIVTVAPEKDETGWARPGSRINVVIVVDEASSDVEVSFALEEVGGPSAGTIFALGIYDELTEGSLGGTAKIAGTGAISLSGEVGAIGGIVHKMRGAAAAGAEVFLAPATNCVEAAGREPEGLEVYAVRTFDEARRVVEAVGRGEKSGLTTCEAIVSDLPA